MHAPFQLLRELKFQATLLAALLIGPLNSLAEIQLGKLTFPTSASKPRALHDEFAVRPTNTKEALTKRLGSQNFLDKVGVAFGGIAEGDNGLVAVDLHYDPKKNDGQRLGVSVRVGNAVRRFNARIYDWQLLPIAKFAATEDVSCCTLFGELESEDEQRRLESSGRKVLNYHDSFRDTLLGLRLMQADLLLIDHNACNVPDDRGT